VVVFFVALLFVALFVALVFVAPVFVAPVCFAEPDTDRWPRFALADFVFAAFADFDADDFADDFVERGGMWAPDAGLRGGRLTSGTRVSFQP